MKASLYNERTDKTTKYDKVETLLKSMDAMRDVARNDSMNTIEDPEFEFMGIEDDCAYFNMR